MSRLSANFTSLSSTAEENCFVQTKGYRVNARWFWRAPYWFCCFWSIFQVLIVAKRYEIKHIYMHNCRLYVPWFPLNRKTYSRCQKYESSPIFVKKLNIRLYPEFLSNQIRTFGPQIRSLGTQTCTLCSTIASNIFALTFLPHLLATLVNLVLYIHGH